MRDINKEAGDELKRLLELEPSALTAPDIEFLKARSSYLNDEQKEMLKKFDTARKAEEKAEAEEAERKAKEDAKELKK